MSAFEKLAVSARKNVMSAFGRECSKMSSKNPGDKVQHIFIQTDRQTLGVH